MYKNKLYIGLVVYGQKSAIRISKILSKLNVDYSIIYPEDNIINYTKFTHIILSGGPKYMYKNDSLPQFVLNCKTPVLGISYGMQLIVASFGGTITPLKKKDSSLSLIVTIIDNNFELIEQISTVWMNRYDTVTSLPEGFEIISQTINGDIASISDGIKWWGVQYHPESDKALHESVFTSFFKI